MTSRLLAYRPEMEMASPAAVLPLQHDDELALAAQLLELRSPQHFATFVSHWLASTGAGRRLRGTPLEAPLRQSLGQLLAPLLPLHGAAPERLRRLARIFGVELEGLSPEDKEFELARRMVQLMRAVVTELARLPASAETAAPQKVAAALLPVARTLAPGLIRHAAQASRPPSSGRWRREGGHIVVSGC